MGDYWRLTASELAAKLRGREVSAEEVARDALSRLEAANPAYETRVLPEDKVRLQGRLVGLIRSY